MAENICPLYVKEIEYHQRYLQSDKKEVNQVIDSVDPSVWMDVYLASPRGEEEEDEDEEEEGEDEDLDENDEDHDNHPISPYYFASVYEPMWPRYIPHEGKIIRDQKLHAYENNDEEEIKEMREENKETMSTLQTIYEFLQRGEVSKI